MKRIFFVTAAALALAACAGSAPGPTGIPDPAILRVVLTTPNTDDGAVLVRVSGGPIDSVTTAGAYTVYDAADGSSSHRIIVQGDLASGVIATLWLPRGAGSAYTATVEQAAAHGSYRQHAMSGYHVALEAAE